MPKKRRKKSGGSWKSVGRFFSDSAKAFFKVMPALVIMFALGATFLGVREALYADPNLTIQKVVVEPPDALAHAQQEKIESAVLGKNILQFDIQSVTSRLEKDPNVLAAHVVKKLPSQLYIEITRREAVAVIRFSPGGNYGVVSADGMILDLVTEKNVSGVVLEATGFSMKQPSIGTQIRDRSFFEAIKFLKAYQIHPMAQFEPLTKIALDHLGNISITLGQGPVIRLGHRPSERLTALEKMLPVLQSEGRAKIDYVDLQFDNAIVKQKTK